jgi:acetolactate synthase-1/2/3 large subunit
MTGARFLAESLDGYGVTHLFHVPTILSRTMVEIEERTSIGRVVTHGEKAAAYMADGYARATGRPGVCAAQMVGAANLAAGLRDAYLACSPLVAVTGSAPPERRYKHGYQQLDDRRMFDPVTKLSVHASSAARLPDLFRQVLRVATSGRPGPTHLELAGDFGELPEREEADLDVFVEDRFARCPAFRPRPEAAAVSAALQLLFAAERPVAVAGGGVRTSGSEAELLELCERLAMPIVTSLNAKDVIGAGHPLACGVVGMYSRESANRVVLESDLVFFVGSQTGAQVTNSWRVPPPATPVVQVDIDPDALGRHYPNAVSVLADAKEALSALLDELRLRSVPPDRGVWLARAREICQEWRSRFAPVLEADSMPLRPERVCRELSRLLPPNALVVADTGHAGMWTGGLLDLESPGHGYIRAAGSLGWALPAALGAALSSPERPVVAFTGDGGLWYHVAELETAVRWGIGAVIVVNDNRSLNQEIHPYTAAYGGHLRGRHGELWRFSDVDLAEVARSMGAIGLRVDDPDKIEGALVSAFAQAAEGRTVVVDAVTDISVTAPLAIG